MGEFLVSGPESDETATFAKEGKGSATRRPSEGYVSGGYRNNTRKMETGSWGGFDLSQFGEGAVSLLKEQAKLEKDLELPEELRGLSLGEK
jgi:hypothetical protein